MNDSRLHRVFLRDLFRARRPDAIVDSDVRFETVLGRAEFSRLAGASALPGEPAVRQLASSSDYRVFVALRGDRVAAVCCVRLGRPAWPGADVAADVYSEPRVARLVHVSSRPEAGGDALVPPLLEHVCWQLRRLGYARCEARVWHNHDADADALERCGWSPRAISDPGRGARPLRWVRDGHISAPPLPRRCAGVGLARADL